MAIKIDIDLDDTKDRDLEVKIITKLFTILEFNFRKFEVFCNSIQEKRKYYTFCPMPNISCKVKDEKVSIVLYEYQQEKIIDALNSIEWLSDYNILITDGWKKANKYLEADD